MALDVVDKAEIAEMRWHKVKIFLALDYKIHNKWSLSPALQETDLLWVQEAQTEVLENKVDIIKV